MIIETIICPQSKTVCTNDCNKELIKMYGNAYCITWIEKQRAIGRKHLEDNTPNPPKSSK